MYISTHQLACYHRVVLKKYHNFHKFGSDISLCFKTSECLSTEDERYGSTANEAGMYVDPVIAPSYQVQNELVLTTWLHALSGGVLYMEP